MLTRRQLMQAGLAGALGWHWPSGVRDAMALPAAGLEPFVDALPIPPVARPIRSAGVAFYELAMREVRQQLHRDLPPTTVWGYAGRYPGPTIEARTHERTRVRWINDLRDSAGHLRAAHYLPVDTCLHGPDTFGNVPRTVVHLHGGHTPPEFDGHPEATWLPGQHAEFEYPNRQEPATLWYHDHALGLTRLNVYMGLAGFYLLRDRNEAALGLPAGRFEIPLMLQDRTVREDGSLVYPARWQRNFFGDMMVVNGKAWPYLDVQPRKYRLRIANGSNHRTYTLSLDSGQPLYQIGSDGGFLSEPVPLQAITLAPAERADVIVDFGNRSGEVVLRNSAPAHGVAAALTQVMQFRVRGTTADDSRLPARLHPVPRLREEAAVRTRDIRFGLIDDPCVQFGSAFLLNEGKRFRDPTTQFPHLGTTEIWRLINPTDSTHPIHIHLVQFQILDRQRFEMMNGRVAPVGNREPPPPNEAGWKDTVRVGPGEIVRVIARFSGFTGEYVFHCHLLEHEDHDMMRPFEVVTGPPRGRDLA